MLLDPPDGSLRREVGDRYPHAFDPFDACVSAAARGDLGDGPFWCPSECAGPVHSAGCMTAEAVRDPARCARFLACAYRVAAAEHLAAARPDLRYDAVAFADSHIVSLRDACDSGRPDGPIPDPSFESVENEDALPDVVQAVAMSNFWYETRPRGVAISHLFSKSLPQRCQFRNLKEIVRGYCVSDEALFRFVVRIVHCSLSGGYRASRVVPRFARRLSLAVGIAETATSAEAFTWLWEHPYCLFYALKEYTVLAVGLEPGLAYTVRRTYRWEEFERYANAGMDVARTSYDRTGDLDAAERDLARTNYRQSKFLFKLRKGSHAQMLLAEVERIARGIPEAHAVRPEPAAIRLGDLERFDREGIEKVHGPALRAMGASDEAVRVLSGVVDVMAGDAANTAVGRSIRSIPEADIAPILSYLRGIQEQSHVRCFALPDHIARAQVASLRVRLGIGPSDPLPRGAGVQYVCTSCRSFKGFVVQPNATCLNLYASGHAKIVYESTNGRLYCGRRREESSHCAETEVLPVSLLGYIARIYGRYYCLCTRCASVMEYAFWKNTARGLECLRCAAEDERIVRKFEEASIQCELCHAPKPARRSWLILQVFDDTGPTPGIRKTHWCERHARRVLRFKEGLELSSVVMRAARGPMG